MEGILLIDKPQNMTSRDVVNHVSQKLQIKKVGHTGTLDPLATGVLVVCVGEATKVSELLTSVEKEYIADVMLGIETDTLDITGNILGQDIIDIEKGQIEKVLKEFVGIYDQEVPIYSAVKVKGKKLYEYARNGEKIQLPKRKIEIKDIEMVGNIYYQDNYPCFKFRCLVSKGTYIRSLIRDICSKLNVHGTMLNLRRTTQGPFNLNDCCSLEDIYEGKLINILDVLDFPKIEADEYLFKKISNGQILENRYKTEKVIFTYMGKLIAIYQIYDKDKTKIKPYKMFGGKK